MPIQAQLHDGRILEFPDGTDPKVIQATVKKVLGVVPETTVLGQVSEAFKGLVPGAVGLVESAAIGASALLPEEQERAAREAIARVAGAAKAPFAPAPGYEDSVVRKTSEAVGSTAPFLLAGPLGLAGRAAAVGLGVGAGAGEARTRAETEGATAEQRGTATALGTIPGALEIFAPFRILARIPEGEVLTAVSRVKRVLTAAGEEAAQEAASGLAQNMIARGVYKPDQALIEGLGEQAAYGGATGAIVQGLMDLALGRRARGTGAGAGAGAPAEGQPGGPPGELPVERLRRERDAKTAAAKAEPTAPGAEIAEPTVRGPKPLPEVLDTETIKTIGFRRGKVHDALVGKAITDPEIRSVLEQAKSRTPSEKTAAKIDAFLARLPEPVESAAPEVLAAPETPVAPEVPPGGLTEQALTDLGLTKRQPIFKRLLGKDPSDESVLADIENYLTKGHGSEESRNKLTEFKTKLTTPETPTAPEAPAVPELTPEQRTDLAEQVERISGQMTEGEYDTYVKEHVDEAGDKIKPGAEHISAAQQILRKYGVEVPEAPTTPAMLEAPVAPPTAPEVLTETPTAPAVPTETPSVSTEPEASGASVPVAGGPAAVSPAEGPGTVEPVRVVPPTEDAGQPVAGEGQQPAAVTPAPATAALAARGQGVPSKTEGGVEPAPELVGERTEATAEDYFARTLGERKTIGLRVQSTDSLAGVEAHMGELYNGSIRDNSGNANPAVLLSQALDAPRFAQEMLRVGTIVVDPSGLSRLTELDYNGQNISFEGVLKDMVAEAKRRNQTPKQFVKEVGEVLAGRREYELMKDNDAREVKLEFYLTPEQAEAANDKFNSDAFIKDFSNKLDAIRFAGIDFLVASGRITEDKAKEWKEATAYVPFKRIEEMDKLYVTQGRGGLPSNLKLAAFKQMKEFKGSSERQTENPIENFVGLMEWIVREGMKAEAVGRALRDLELIGAAKYLPRGENQLPQSQKGAVVSSWQKGQQKFYYVPDPANLAAFAGTKSGQVANFVKQAQKLSQVLRVGVTITPAFALKQVADDITRAYVHSGVKNPLALIPRILSNMPRNWWNEVKGTRSAGVAQLAKVGVVPSYDTIEGGNVRNIFEETGISKRSPGRAILRILEAGAKASDVSVRQAIYDQTMKETGDAALAESRAREIINFSRRGASATADFFIRTIPFFNAYARSMDKLLLAAVGGKTVGVSTGYARNLFFKRMGVLTAMGFAYAMMMWDDEEYQNLPDHVRDRNWVFPNGKELGFTPVMPLPPELSFFFKAIPERVVQYYKLQGTPEERDALRVARELMLSGVDIFMTPNLTPQLVKPFLENLVNYSYFLGRPLESQSQLRLDPSQRFGTGTSEAVKASAEALAQLGIEMSPIKIENAIRGVFGMSAGLALSVADVMVNPTRTDRPLHQSLTAQLTGVSAFMKDPVGTRFLDDMYDFEDKVAQAYNTYNRLVQTDPEKADAYLLQNYGRYSVYDAVKATMESIRDLNREAQLIDRTKDIPPDERRQIMNVLRAQQNELAQISYALRRQAQINQTQVTP